MSSPKPSPSKTPVNDEKSTKSAARSGSSASTSPKPVRVSGRSKSSQKITPVSELRLTYKPFAGNINLEVLRERLTETKNRSEAIASELRLQVGKDNFIDVGKGAAETLGEKETDFRKALEVLREEGYRVWYLPKKQIGDSNLSTTIKILSAPGTTFSAAAAGRGKIKSLNDAPVKKVVQKARQIGRSQTQKEAVAEALADGKTVRVITGKEELKPSLSGHGMTPKKENN